MQRELFELPGPAADEIRAYSPEYLYEKHRIFYDRKHTEYEHELAAMGRMKQENRNIPVELFSMTEKALKTQLYITAGTEANPHQYCLRKSWRGNTSFVSVAETIRKYGYVEWFWRKPYMMLNVGEFKYWTMGWPLEVTVLINRTKIVPCTRADLLRYR
jgi:hypothetical protein